VVDRALSLLPSCNRVDRIFLPAGYKRPEKPGDYIGFIGCDQVGLQPVRMAASRRSMRVVCPHCGEIHVTSDPMPRLRRGGEVVALIEDGMGARRAGRAAGGTGDRQPPARRRSADGLRRRPRHRCVAHRSELHEAIAADFDVPPLAGKEPARRVGDAGPRDDTRPRRRRADRGRGSRLARVRAAPTGGDNVSAAERRDRPQSRQVVTAARGFMPAQLI
jgi:hypothetical protein